MAKIAVGVRCFLKQPNEAVSAIKMIYCYNKLQFCYYERKLSVPTKFWNPESQRARANKSFPGHASLNDTLDVISKIIVDSHREIKNRLGREPLLSELRACVEQKRNAPERQEDQPFNASLLIYMEEFLKRADKNDHYNPNRLRAAETTIRSYKQTFKLLNAYCNARGAEVDLESVNHSFAMDFSSFLYYEYSSAQQKSKQPYSPNTCAKHLANIKAVMADALNRGKINTSAFRGIKVKRQETDEVYLTPDELKALYEHDFSANRRLEKVRDIFVLGCQLAFRYSDLKSITASCFIRDEDGLFIKKVQQKTKDPVYVPVNPLAEEIIMKYCSDPAKPEMPKLISEQKFRQYIKEAASKVSKLQELYRRKEYENVQVVEKDYPKWQLISTHTMRRTFATVWSEKGERHEDIMRITGHKSYKSFEKYVRNKSSLSQKARRIFASKSLLD